MSDITYFAVDPSVEDLIEKVQQYYSDLDSLGYLEKIQRAYNQYYGVGLGGISSKTTPKGRQGERVGLSINTFRSLLRHQLTLITSERPAYEARPINTDYKSIAQADLGEDILDYYMDYRDIENILYTAAEKSIYSSEGFVEIFWDFEAGNIYSQDIETEKPVMEGDVAYRTYSALDVVRDIRKEGEQDWVILRSYENKFDIAARYEEHAEHILNLSTLGEQNKFKSWFSSETNRSDVIPVWKFYHKKCAALPEGKLIIFVEDRILLDSVFPYTKINKIPVFRVAPGNLINSCLGYTQAFDLLALQEVTDDLYEAIISNNIAFSTQCVQGPKDAAINVSQIAEGLNYIEYDGDKPLQALQLTRSAPETYDLIRLLEGHMEKFTGINDVIRGDPGANLRSGNALALVAAQSIKFNSTLENSYIKLFEQIGTGTLQFLQEFAQAPRFISIVGKSKKGYLKEFSSKEIDRISHVEVKRASALSKTTAGKLEIANNLLQNGLLNSPEQYIMVLETGKLNVMVEPEQTELMSIKAENERLKEGGDVIALAIDNHQIHVKSHKAVISDPEAREDPVAVQKTLAHIKEHMDLWAQQDPNLLMALGIPPLQAPPQAPPPQGGNTSAGVAEVPGAEEVPNMPNLPNLPEAASEQDIDAYNRLGLQQ